MEATAEENMADVEINIPKLKPEPPRDHFIASIKDELCAYIKSEIQPVTHT